MCSQIFPRRRSFPRSRRHLEHQLELASYLWKLIWFLEAAVNLRHPARWRRAMVLLLGLVCSSHALLVPQRAPPKLAQPQPARPNSPLRCPRLSMFEVESSSSTVVACSKRKPADEGVFGQEKVGSLGQYLNELTSAQLATALESRLSHLITASPSPSNPNAVVVALRESFYFGPRILHLWIKPRMRRTQRRETRTWCAVTCPLRAASHFFTAPGVGGDNTVQ